MKKVNFYTDEFKLQVIKEVISGKITKEQAKRIYQLGGNSAVLNWMRKFGIAPPGIKEKIVNLPAMEKETNNQELLLEIERLKSEKQALEKALQLTQLKAESYEIMLEIAKEEFDLDLRKKSGAKQ